MVRVIKKINIKQNDNRKTGVKQFDSKEKNENKNNDIGRDWCIYIKCLW